MRYLVVLLFLLFIPLKMAAQVDVNQLDAKGRKTGRWRVMHPEQTGKVYSDGVYLAGVRIGLWKFYDVLGNIRTESEYLEGGQTANVKLFYPGGKKSGEGLYRNKLREGTWYFYGPESDTLWVIREHYKNGKREGECIKRYSNGDVFETLSFVGDKKSGEWKQYYPGNLLKARGNFQNGLLQGQITYFYENGKKYMEGVYHQDVRHGIFLYFEESGRIKMRLRYKWGVLNEEDAKQFEVPDKVKVISEEEFERDLRKSLDGIDGGRK
jgi:antitoxin component YwqK of YwqJK toxin-antitoxin module